MMKDKYRRTINSGRSLSRKDTVINFSVAIITGVIFRVSSCWLCLDLIWRWSPAVMLKRLKAIAETEVDNSLFYPQLWRCLRYNVLARKRAKDNEAENLQRTPFSDFSALLPHDCASLVTQERDGANHLHKCDFSMMTEPSPCICKYSSRIPIAV